MLAIGRGLMAEPVLLILDEPSLGLSPLLVEEMFALIRQLRDDGLAVLLVEQNVGQSLDVADRAYVLENGSVRFSGTPAGAARERRAAPCLSGAVSPQPNPGDTPLERRLMKRRDILICFHSQLA